MITACLAATTMLFGCEEDITSGYNYVILPDFGLMVMKKDMGKSTFSAGNEMCAQIRLGGFSDWRLPNQGELSIMYQNRYEIGGFDTTYRTQYWSTTPSMAGGFYACVNFTDGSVKGNFDMFNQQAHGVRCVRSAYDSSR